jgi:hypothetical protein
MFQLKVNSPNLDEFSVVLIKSTLQDYAVVCGLWSAGGGLPTNVIIDTLYAYASNFQEFQDCLTISADIPSAPLVQGNIYEFNGTMFVQGGPTPSDFAYGLRNGWQTPIACGLCQAVTVSCQPANPPVCVQRLAPGFTTYFPTNDLFWLGVGQFPGLKDPQPGLLLSTSIIQAALEDKSSQGCVATLGPFTSVDFSETQSWTATYDEKINSFQLQSS